MAVKLNDSEQGSSNGSQKYMGEGVFIEPTTISRVEDFSNYPTRTDEPVKTFNSGRESELCLIVYYKARPEDESERKMFLFGNFKWETDYVSGKKKKFLGWNPKNNSVQSFLYRMTEGKIEINDDFTIPETALKSLEGKTFYKLKYCTGARLDEPTKPNFQDFPSVMLIDKEGEDLNKKGLYQEFLKQVPYLENAKKNRYDSKFYDLSRKQQDNADTSFNTDDFADSPI